VGEHSGVKLRVAQPHIGDAIERRRWNDAAECAGAAKPTSSVMISRMFGAPFGGAT
jgi:hypothetical protein